jgi:hypothetical protein
MWRKILVALLPFIAAGFIGYSIYPKVHKKPAPPEPEIIVKHDTLYFTWHDTIIPPPVVVTEKPVMSDTTPSRIRTTVHKETPSAKVDLEMFAKCKVDSILLKVTPKMQIIEREKLVVCTDTIKTITITKEKKSWWRDVKNVALGGAIVYLWVSTKHYWEK